MQPSELLASWDAESEHPFDRAVRLIAELTGLRAGTSGWHATMIGPPAYYVHAEHDAFAAWMIKSIQPMLGYPIARWALLNHLLLLRGQFSIPRGPRTYEDPQWMITSKSTYLASLVGFGLLEQVAMLRTGLWDEEGRALTRIDNDRIVDLRGKKRIYTPPQPINDLRHKLILVEEHMTELGSVMADIRHALTNQWRIVPSEPPQPLYDRLFDARNRMMHGATDEGWEAWLLTLLCFLVYGDHVLHEAARSSR